MRLKDWITRHPALAYTLLTVALSWGIWSFLFLVIKPGGMVDNPPPAALIIAMLGLLGPVAGGLGLTALIYGRAGLRTYWARLSPCGLGAWWLALLIIPAITALTPLLRWAAGFAQDGATLLGAIFPGLMIGLVAGVLEELGWRGFLLPHLLKRYSPLAATVVLGLIWGGVWHGYADYFGLGNKDWATWPLIALLGPVLLTAWSLILTRVFERTQGNLLLAILMHASLSSSAFIFGQKYATLTEEVTWTAISVGAAWLGAAVVWLLLRQPAARPASQAEARAAAAVR